MNRSCSKCGEEIGKAIRAKGLEVGTLINGIEFVSSCCRAKLTGSFQPPKGGASVEPDKDLESFRDQIAFEYMKYELRLTDPRGLLMKPEALKEAETRRKERIAKESYQMADIMLKERSKPPLDITTSDGNPPRKP